MIRVTADTNVYISALLFGGLPGTFLDLALLGSFELITSGVLLDELTDKLRSKFEVPESDVSAIRKKLELVAAIVEPEQTIHAVQNDPDDDRVLECALAGKADYVVTGDRHLLQLGKYQAIPIIRVREFLSLVKANF